LKYGLKPALVDPRGTSSSYEHRFVMKKYGLDRHTASAYLIALRYLQDEKTINNHKTHKQHKQTSKRKQPKFVKCTRCGFTHDRDVVGAWNTALKLDVSSVPLGSKGAHDPCVEWLVATMNRRAEAQPALGKPTKT
ncbi:MAG: zinc ribbon domain-containing protein, partial [Desulfurococcaceae archaeon]